MKKKIITFLSFIFLSFSMLTGCGGFIQEESLVISSITSEVLDDGTTLIIVTYTDEEIAPSTFHIPKGDTGEQGIQGEGIKDFTSTIDPLTGDVTFTITFTDEEMEPIIYTLKNGVSISYIETELNEETGDTYVTVVFSDGTKSDPFTIPRGKDGENGKDGNSITGIRQKVNEDGSVTLTIRLSSGDDVVVEIPAPIKGEDGRGIQKIESSPKGDIYEMIITYTDGETVNLEFARPNKWYSESSSPSDTEGINGDLWYDLAHNIIYVKQNNRWVEVMNFNNVVDETYTVSFDLNDSLEAKASMPAGSLLLYEIESGKYFGSSGYIIPSPTRPGYEFMGWYLVKNPTAVNGAFTDLTPVHTDLTLFAVWDQL